MNERDKGTDDALLSAYLDGELPAREAEKLEMRLADDPLLASRLAAMRTADQATRKLYARIDELPMPQHVLDLLKEDGADVGGDAHESNVIAFPRRGIRQFVQMPVALAASVALAAGFLLSGLVSRESGTGSGVPDLYAGAIPNGSELHRLLETGQGPATQTLASGADGRVILTFQAEDGDYCRQFQLDAGSGSMHALACRRDDGAWRMETASYADSAAPGGLYQQASGAAPAALDAAVEALMGDREPLDPRQESLLISNSWRNPQE
jgi:negative regulator of sigma E activity